MYRSFVTHSPADEEHPGCFQVLAIMNEAAVSICVQIAVETEVFNSLGQFQEAQSLDGMVRARLVL